MSIYRYDRVCEWCQEENATHWSCADMWQLPDDAIAIDGWALFLCGQCKAQHAAGQWEPPIRYGTVDDLKAALEPTPHPLK